MTDLDKIKEYAINIIPEYERVGNHSRVFAYEDIIAKIDSISKELECKDNE